MLPAPTVPTTGSTITATVAAAAICRPYPHTRHNGFEERRQRCGLCQQLLARMLSSGSNGYGAPVLRCFNTPRDRDCPPPIQLSGSFASTP